MDYIQDVQKYKYVVKRNCLNVGECNVTKYKML